MMEQTTKCQTDEFWMSEALRLAQKGQGFVEPNPMVGCVIVRPGSGHGQVVGQGFHEKFGEPHAEIKALHEAGEDANGATVYVTLEPCAHSGKTPPCADALIKAQVARVVIGAGDPFDQVDGQGIEKLVAGGIDVTTEVCIDQANELIRPYVKRVKHNLPWMVAKWAMTLDGKIATATGESQWISNASSREIVHQLRGRVDAIMIGSQTAEKDDPLLTARPAGSRTATRIVLDSSASLSLESKLVKTVKAAPVLVAVGPEADRKRCERLQNAGCELWRGTSSVRDDRLMELIRDLANRGMTNVLVEGGGELLGSLLQLGQIDEVHTFIGPMLVGGHNAMSPVAGQGFDSLNDAKPFVTQSIREVDGDVYIVARSMR